MKLILFFLIFSTIQKSYSDENSDQSYQIRQNVGKNKYQRIGLAEKDISSLNQRLEEREKNENSLIEKVDELKKSQSLLQEEINKLKLQLEEQNQEIIQLKTSITESSPKNAGSKNENN